MAGSGPAGGSRRARAEQTEVALKQAGRRVFARSGYLDAKITDIAAEAGRSVGSFYKHFAGKEELLQALLADWIAQAGQDLAGHQAGSDLSEEPALRARVAVYWHTYRAHLPEIRALGQAAQVSPAFARQLAQFRHAQLDIMREHLERLRAAGLRPAGRPGRAGISVQRPARGLLRDLDRRRRGADRPDAQRRRGDQHPDRGPRPRPGRPPATTPGLTHSPSS